MSLSAIRKASSGDLHAGLNDPQRAAVEHGVGDPRGPEPLLIIAGAGAGKTNTLAYRVMHLIVSGADPKRIMLVTFSRRAASELIQRVRRLLHKHMPPELAKSAALSYTGTFHSIGARLLREYAERVGLDPNFTIHDREDSADLMNWARHACGLSDSVERFPGKATCLAIYSRAINAREPLETTLSKRFPWVAKHEPSLRTLFSAYVEAKQRHGVLDYDDLLLYLAHMLVEPAIVGEIAARFDHLLVDEYQDTNQLQAEIARALRPNGRGLTVVGDDAQSIYSFRAATVRNILDFPKTFDPPARVITLDRNYRSTRPILEASNAVVSLAAERFAKALWTDRDTGGKPKLVNVADEKEQARFVAESVLENREAGEALKSQAVLFRAAHHSAALELELMRRDIPFVKFGGLKFLDAAHIKDALALLRFAENPQDRLAGLRVAQLLPGIGPASAERIVTAAGSNAPFEALRSYRPPPKAQKAYLEFVEVLERLRKGALWPSDLGEAVTWRRAHLDDRYDNVASRSADLDALERIASTYVSRERFLSDMALDPPDATSDEAGPPLKDEDYLILSTIHSAKGQEWRSVFVLNCVDGCIPSDLATGTSDEIEEERRLLYVAMTRAMDELNLIVPMRFFAHGQVRGGDRHVLAARSRFLPPHVLSHFDCVAWPTASQTEVFPPPAGPRVDIAASLRSMWK